MIGLRILHCISMVLVISFSAISAKKNVIMERSVAEDIPFPFSLYS